MAVVLGKKTKTVNVELSEEVRSALAGLDADIVVVTGLLEELVASQKEILNHVKGEISMKVIDALGDDVDGIEVFAEVFGETEPEVESAIPFEKKKDPKQIIDVKGKVEIPDSMTFTEPDQVHVAEEDRLRTTPFTRAPRHTQVAWLKKVMGDGDWYSTVGIAREYATDERHFRYMRGAVQGRLREMHEEGEVDRRDSHVKGAMFEYRLKPPKVE